MKINWRKTKLLGWCKNNCGFYIVEICLWYWNTFYKYGYIIPHFNVHFSLYFFANSLLLVYFIFILDYVNGVRQKQIWTIFLFQFKMGHRAGETTCKINNAFGLGTAIEGGSRSFEKETRALKMRSVVASHQKSTITNWVIIETDPLKLHKKLLKNSKLTILTDRNGIYCQIPSEPGPFVS